MNLRWIRYFVALAEAQSFSEAARRIHVAQPALSRQLRDLEADLNVVLFHRSSGGIRLTEEGARFYPVAVDLLRRVDQLRSGFTRNGAAVTGRVIVGLPTSASEVLAAPLALEARRLYPGIQLHIIESLSGFLSEWVTSGRVDVALLYDPQPSQKLVITPVLREQLHLFGAPDCIAALGGAGLGLSDVLRLPLVLPGFPHSLRRMLAELGDEIGTRPDVVIEADSLQAIAKIAASGEAFAILTPSAVQEYLKRGQLGMAPLVAPPLGRNVAVVKSFSHMESAASASISGLCADLARCLVTDKTWAGATLI